jgi:hypothetical protein
MADRPPKVIYNIALGVVRRADSPYNLFVVLGRAAFFGREFRCLLPIIIKAPRAGMLELGLIALFQLSGMAPFKRE